MDNKLKISLAVVGLLIIGVVGVQAKSFLDNQAEEERLEAERIEKENMPVIANNCVMNGYGSGSCSFTNTGKTTGAVCGTITVWAKGSTTLNSNKFCSGQVESLSTTQVAFNIPSVNKTCEGNYIAGESWTDVCDFNFIES